jgi:hypothetical protein
MPTSPNSRAENRTEGKPNTSAKLSTASTTSPTPNGSAEQKKQTSSSRKLQRQNLMRRFMKSREDAQLAGLIETTPKEAIGKIDERVKHDDPKLIETAIKSGWAVPEEIKPELIQEMVAIVTDDTEEVSDKTKVAAFRALLTADQHQHERDNPQVKSKSGGTVNVSVQTNIAAVDVLRQALRQDTQTLLPSIQPPEIKDK